jgi:hypothetical protein
MLYITQATIIDGDTVSTIIDTLTVTPTMPISAKNPSLLALSIPDTWTPGTLSFLASFTGEAGTFYPLTEFSGADIAVSISNAVILPLVANYFAGARYIQIQNSATQTQDCVISLSLGAVLGN